MNVVLEIGIHLASSMIATNRLFQHPRLFATVITISEVPSLLQ